MGGADQDDDKAAEPVQIRFRAFAADGRQVLSAEQRLERAVPPPARLRRPYFGHAGYKPGDKARIVVDAAGLARGDVKLVIEKQSGEEWSQADELSSAIDHGAAWATWTVPPEEGTGPARYRVRAVTAFGEETSDPIAVQSEKGELADPSFTQPAAAGGAHFHHPGEALLRVGAKGLDGRSVRFVVERQQGGGWAPLQTLTATVANGEAAARLILPHPVVVKSADLAEVQSPEGFQIRFHAELA